MQGTKTGTPVLGLLDGQPGAPEQVRNETPDVGVVVDHEDAGAIHTLLILARKRVPYQPGRH